jgi:hypothetical protein
VSSKHQVSRKPQGLEDKTPSRIYEEFEIPLEEITETVEGEEAPDPSDDVITRQEATTQDFGVLQFIGLKRLTPLEEKTAVSKARGDSMRIAYELSEAALGYVINTEGVQTKVHLHDGTTNTLLAQMHPKIRALVMEAYGEIAAPARKASASFIKSRKTRA